MRTNNEIATPLEADLKGQLSSTAESLNLLSVNLGVLYPISNLPIDVKEYLELMLIRLKQNMDALNGTTSELNSQIKEIIHPQDDESLVSVEPHAPQDQQALS